MSSFMVVASLTFFTQSHVRRWGRHRRAYGFSIPPRIFCILETGTGKSLLRQPLILQQGVARSAQRRVLPPHAGQRFPLVSCRRSTETKIAGQPAASARLIRPA